MQEFQYQKGRRTAVLTHEEAAAANHLIAAGPRWVRVFTEADQLEFPFTQGEAMKPEKKASKKPEPKLKEKKVKPGREWREHGMCLVLRYCARKGFSVVKTGKVAKALGLKPSAGTVVTQHRYGRKGQVWQGQSKEGEYKGGSYKSFEGLRLSTQDKMAFDQIAESIPEIEPKPRAVKTAKKAAKSTAKSASKRKTIPDDAKPARKPRRAVIEEKAAPKRSRRKLIVEAALAESSTNGEAEVVPVAQYPESVTEAV